MESGYNEGSGVVETNSLYADVISVILLARLFISVVYYIKK